MLHPNSSPPAPASSATSRHTAANSTGCPKLKFSPDPIISHAAGITTSPETIDWIIPAITFSTASHRFSIGASSRSSISFVKLNSSTSGRAVDCSDVSSAVRATMPGKSRWAYPGRV